MALYSRRAANRIDFCQSFPGMAVPSGDTRSSSKGLHAVSPQTTWQHEPGRVLGCAGSVAISEASLKGIFVVAEAN